MKDIIKMEEKKGEQGRGLGEDLPREEKRPQVTSQRDTKNTRKSTMQFSPRGYKKQK